MLRVLVLLGIFAVSCSKVTVPMSDLACGEEGCASGWVCHPETGICVEEIEVGCDGSGYCPTTVQSGDPCEPLGAFLPCVEGVTDCSAGCRTCEETGWSECTAGECTLGELTSCASCDDDCTASVENADPICNTGGTSPVCDYTGDCYTGYRDGDDNRATGCETVCVQSNGGVETCDGQDNDCNGIVDDVGDLDADCDAKVTGESYVATWSCPAGSCTVVICDVDHWDANTSGADGCEYACTQSNGGDETCDGADNDCNNLLDDVVDPTADCFAILPDDEPEVVSFACTGGACLITSCNAGFVDTNDDPDDGCEETCTDTNGGVEQCDGEDNNCDGTIDNAAEGASGCRTYYLDADFDAFGVTGDSECWCVPTGNYTATTEGDCDDSVGTCTTDCTTNVDGDGLRDCEDTCIDGDGDGYGEPGGAGDTCTAGDCDDAVGTCTTDCGTNDDGDGLRDCEDTCVDSDGDGYGAPGGAGNTCTGADCAEGVPSCNADCTTDADGDGTRDCEDTCLDADGDGYGAPGGAGNTCTGADCDDDPSGCGAACNAGESEICDNQDNDCQNGIDDGLGVACHCTGGASPPLPPEDCGVNGTGNGIDDDCNGAIDEICVQYIEPSNLGAVDLCQGTFAFTATTGATVAIDTDWPPAVSGVTLPSSLVAEDIDQGPGNPHITVLYFSTITIASTATVNVTGAPALALVACTDVTIDGDLVACAAGQGAGAGGWAGGGREGDGAGPAGGEGGSGNNRDPYQQTGGGGGGYCTAGGIGGDGTGSGGGSTALSGGAAGGPYSVANAETLVPLIGGSGGGGGGDDFVPGGQVGGGGGGAIQIVANNSITINGGINACGAGGSSDSSTRWGGGAGGGSGGAILLEAEAVTVAGTIAANGGGGGGGDCSWGSNNPTSTAGESGRLAASRASAGDDGDGSYNGGTGGRGGADSGGNATGEDGQDEDCGGGAGGGVGFIRINTDGTGALDDSGTVSPDEAGCYTTGDVTYQ